MDMVFLKSLENLGPNVVAADDAQKLGNAFEISEEYKRASEYGSKVSNAIFHNEANHVFLKTCIDNFHKTFSGSWGSGGPTLFQNTLEQLCGGQRYLFLNPEVHNAEKCKGMKVSHPR